MRGDVWQRWLGRARQCRNGPADGLAAGLAGLWRPRPSLPPALVPARPIQGQRWIGQNETRRHYDDVSLPAQLHASKKNFFLDESYFGNRVDNSLLAGLELGLAGLQLGLDGLDLLELDLQLGLAGLELLQ